MIVLAGSSKTQIMVRLKLSNVRRHSTTQTCNQTSLVLSGEVFLGQVILGMRRPHLPSSSSYSGRNVWKQPLRKSPNLGAIMRYPRGASPKRIPFSLQCVYLFIEPRRDLLS